MARETYSGGWDEIMADLTDDLRELHPGFPVVEFSMTPSTAEIVDGLEELQERLGEEE